MKVYLLKGPVQCYDTPKQFRTDDGLVRSLFCFAALTFFNVSILASSTNAQTALDKFCEGECRMHVFAGTWIDDGMFDIFVEERIPPWDWDYRWDERIFGFAFSKKVASYLNDTVEIEPEFGVALRTGAEDTQEIWLAIYLRYDGFLGTIISTPPSASPLV